MSTDDASSLPSPPSETASDAVVFAYIAQMSAELRSLSHGPKFRTVNYLLDMARLEAERSVKEVPH